MSLVLLKHTDGRTCWFERKGNKLYDANYTLYSLRALRTEGWRIIKRV